MIDEINLVAVDGQASLAPCSCQLQMIDQIIRPSDLQTTYAFQADCIEGSLEWQIDSGNLERKRLELICD